MARSVAVHVVRPPPSRRVPRVGARRRTCAGLAAGTIHQCPRCLPTGEDEALSRSYSRDMTEQTLRVLASGATELWADGVRAGNRLGALGNEALEAERPFHVATPGNQRTLCDTPVRDLREYPIDFAAQEQRIRCPLCDERLGHPVANSG